MEMADNSSFTDYVSRFLLPKLIYAKLFLRLVILVNVLIQIGDAAAFGAVIGFVGVGPIDDKEPLHLVCLQFVDDLLLHRTGGGNAGM